MSRFAYPVDTDQFQIIRENGMLYVDKTDMMWELADRYSYVFLARPRRFGKSLLCNTFKAYFQGQKELFDGLKVMELEKEWKKYPVLHFTMSGLKNCTVEEAKGKLELLISRYEEVYGRNLSEVTKFSQLSIFSELNNLNQISFEDKYSGLCGITQKELDTTLRPCIEEYAENLGITIDEAYTLLKKNYDGYHFSTRSEDIYAPFSLLRALDGKNTYHYWFESGTTTALIEHLKHHPEFNPLDFDGAELSLDAFNAPCESAETPIPLLYQSGYLTIKDYNSEDEVYNLHFPNYEVRQGMVKGLTNYLMSTDTLERDAAVLAMSRALKKGDLSSALLQMRSWIASLPYDIITKKEWMRKKSRENFYKLIIYTVFTLVNSKVDTEVKSILGRADVVIQTKNDVFVLELKVDDTVENALAQIDDKGYAIPYEADGRKVTKCGVCIASEQRNITHWRITDKDGNIIGEQKF